MPLKSEILMLSKLNLKKFRDSENKFIVEGKRLVSEGIKSKFNCLQILITNEFEKKDFEYCN
ncbi:MAG: hypothetical protein KDD59_14560, partial [Bdellovibrionales bacterium]|nr:hypothetical protein [Bdellovibrionales bacterium]